LAITLVTLLAATAISSYFAWRAAQDSFRADQQAAAVTDTLYDELMQEIRLTSEVRSQGYGQVVRGLVNQARDLPTARVNKDELRRQLVLSMGDFVAYPPVVIKPAEGQTTSICLSSDGREIIAGLGNGRLFAYDGGTGKQRAELEAFDAPVQSIAIAADDRRL